MPDFISDGVAVSAEQTYQALRTVSFKSVLWGVARLAGYKPDTRELSVERAEMLTEFINERVREAWEYTVWPDLRRVEQRYYHQGLWSAGSWAAGAIVYYSPDETYYEANIGTSETPGAAATDWDVKTSYSKLIPWEQLASTKLGAVERVTYSDPRINRTPTDLVYRTADREGLYVLDHRAAHSVWLTLLVREPEFNYAVHNPNTSYGAGAISYWPATGECYLSLVSGNQVADPSVSGNWDQVEFPYVFASFVKRAAYADWLRAHKQHDLADRHERKALGRLDDTQHRQGVNQQTPLTAVVTRPAAVS